MGRNMIILQGSVQRYKFVRGAADATAVSMILKNIDTEVVSTFTASYSSGVAVVELGEEDTAVVGTYQYQVNETTPDGTIKYRTGDCGGDDCIFGIITICESLDEVE